MINSIDNKYDDSKYKTAQTRSADGHRKFNDLPTQFSFQNVALVDENENNLNDKENKYENVNSDLFQLIRKSEIGFDKIFSGPFGYRNGSHNSFYLFDKLF
jgi:hypothetical protein